MRDQILDRKDDRMFKLLLGAALGFGAAWLMDSKEGEQRRALVKDKATGLAGKGKEQALGAVNQVKQKASSSTEQVSGQDGGGSYESATSGDPIAESEPTTAPGPEAFKQS
jgi:gas vesicle protein